MKQTHQWWVCQARRQIKRKLWWVIPDGHCNLVTGGIDDWRKITPEEAEKYHQMGYHIIGK